jgi:uncharacterized surface protein with fasciclin (FAS1) repeats
MPNSFSKTAILCMALSGLVSSAHAADLVETMSKSGEIKTFATALKESGLDEQLKANGPYTVFAPSNSAFQKIPPNIQSSLFKDKKKLAQFVSQHVLPVRLLVDDVKPGPAKTLAGTEVRLKSDNGKITVNEANVTLSDIEADNGVIHVIDTVVLPPQ